MSKQGPLEAFSQELLAYFNFLNSEIRERFPPRKPDRHFLKKMRLSPPDTSRFFQKCNPQTMIVTPKTRNILNSQK